MKQVLRPAIVLFALLTAITGIVYPLAVTGVAKALFAEQASGSLVTRGGGPAGSLLIGQSFSDPRYFWGRPSATGPQPYNGAASSGSNQGPLNPALADAVKARVEALRAADPENSRPVPADLVTASGSGLDPLEQRVRVGAAVVGHFSASSARLSASTLTRGSPNSPHCRSSV